MTPLPAAVAIALAAFLVVIVAERLGELALSARNARILRARGAVEAAPGHFLVFVVLHALFPLALLAEVRWLGARPGPLWPLWLALVAAAQALRFWCVRALGDRWNARIWVTPGEPLVTRGPYRWMRHPNYLAVSVELPAAALLFGAWRTALAASALNAVAMAIRIPAEQRALARR